jgi:hypothetical protein
VLRAIAHLAVVLLLVAALVAGACVACAPVKAGGCCDPAGHCKKVSKSCGDPSVAVLNPVAPAIELPVFAVVSAPAPPAEFDFSPAPQAPDSPPDLCLLHSVLRV